MTDDAMKGVTSESTADAGGFPRDLNDYLDMPLNISIEFGQTKMSIKDILDLSYNSVVAIPKSAGENVDVMANGKLIAFGEIITVEETTGVIITDIANE